MGISEKTTQQYNAETSKCRELFILKNRDYGTSWRVLRPSSLTDQIFIKAKRIRSIEKNARMKIDEGSESEYIGIANYCLITLIQIKLGESNADDLTSENLISKYDAYKKIATDLMIDKNHDYGEAWRDMRISTYTDMILARILRIKQIENNNGKTLASEGIESNYLDMYNYAIFALIRLSENN